MTAQHREGLKKKKKKKRKESKIKPISSSSKARTKHVKRSGQIWSAQIPVPPSSSTLPAAIAILSPLENLRAPHPHSRSPVHAPRAFHLGPLSPPQKQKADHEWGGAGECRKKKTALLAGPGAWRKQAEAGRKHTVPCNLSTSEGAPGLHAPGRWGPEAKLITPGRKTQRGGLFLGRLETHCWRSGARRPGVCRAGGLEAGCGARASRAGVERAEGLRGALWAEIPAPGVAPGSCPGLTVRNLEQGRRWDKKGLWPEGAQALCDLFQLLGGTEQPGREAGGRLPEGRGLLRRRAGVSWALTRNRTWASGQSHLSQQGIY